VFIAVAPASSAAVGCVLVGAEAVGTAGAGAVLGATFGEAPQGYALGAGAVCAGGLSVDLPGQRMAPASAMARSKCAGRSAAGSSNSPPCR
jgi:hypothetical protein